MRKNIVAIVLSGLFLRLTADAQTLQKTQYIGDVTINASQDTRVLADWYTKFGAVLTPVGGGFYWGSLSTAAGPFLIGIHPPADENSPKKSSGSVTVKFRVDDYDGTVALIQGRGLVPESTEGKKGDKFGRFANYRDPDGNGMTIWGD